MSDKNTAQNRYFLERALAFLVAFVCCLCRMLLEQNPVLAMSMILSALFYGYLAVLRVNKKSDVVPLGIVGAASVVLFVISGIAIAESPVDVILYISALGLPAVALVCLPFLACIPFGKSPERFSKLKWIPPLCILGSAAMWLITVFTQEFALETVTYILQVAEYVALAVGLYFLSAYLVAPKPADEDGDDLYEEPEWEEKKWLGKRWKITSKWFLFAMLFFAAYEIMAMTVVENRSPLDLICQTVILLLYAFLNPHKIWYKILLGFEVFMYSVTFAGYIQALTDDHFLNKPYMIPAQGAHILMLLLLLLLPAAWVERRPKLRFLPAFFKSISGVMLLGRMIETSGPRLLTMPYPDMMGFLLKIGYHVCCVIAIYQLSQKIFIRKRRKSPPKELVTSEATETAESGCTLE